VNQLIISSSSLPKLIQAPFRRNFATAGAGSSEWLRRTQRALMVAFEL
jgi:hypothetical protein